MCMHMYMSAEEQNDEAAGVAIGANGLGSTVEESDPARGASPKRQRIAASSSGLQADEEEDEEEDDGEDGEYEPSDSGEDDSGADDSDDSGEEEEEEGVDGGEDEETAETSTGECAAGLELVEEVVALHADARTDLEAVLHGAGAPMEEAPRVGKGKGKAVAAPRAGPALSDDSD